jgi:RNA polymerase sigma factor (sigma-70 family)
MTLEWNRIEPWQYVVDTVAKEYKKRFNMVDIEDIRQTLYEWFVEHPNKLTTWEEMGTRSAKNLIYRSLRNQALDYCQEWKANSSGYESSDLFYYESDLVEALLPSVLRGEKNITHKLDLGRVSGGSAPSEGGNIQAMMIEINLAYSKLAKEDKQVLFLRYAESMDYEAIGKELDLGSEDAVRMRNNRIVRRLIQKIGGFKPFYDTDDVPVASEESSLES